VTALNAILARQGQINPQSGVVGGQQGLPMSGGVMQSKPLGMQGTIPQGGNVVQGQRLQAPVGYNRDPRQNTQFNALSPQDQERYYQGGMNRAPGQNPMLNNKANAINMPIQDQYYGTGMTQYKPPGQDNRFASGMPIGQDNFSGMANPAQAVTGAAQGDTPQTGLIGAEQALGIATSGLSEAGAQARRDLEAGYSGSQQNLESAYQGVGQAGDQARTDINRGLYDSSQSLESAFQGVGQAGNQARSDINRGLYDSSQSLRSGSEMVGQAGSRSINDFLGGTQQGRQDINRSSQAALQPLSRFAQSGQDANALQANLLGANGPAAQAAAMQQFQDSPGQDFLREEQERAVLRNSAATGGTQGGAVLEELQRRAFGRAGTAFNDRISQLGGLGSQGLTASQGQAGIMSDAGRALSGLAERGSSNIANTRLGVAGQQADIQGDLSGLMERGAGNLATAGLNVAGQQAGIRGDLSGLMERGAGNLATAGLNVAGQQAGLQQAMGGLSERNASNLASTGLGIAGQLSGIQGTVAGGRTRAGEQIAQNIGSTTNNLANLQNAEGAALAQILDGGQFAEIMAKAGITDANTLQQLATLLANISTGQGSQATGLGGIPGVTQTEGALAGIGQAAAGAGAAMTGFAAMSDIRLKENIVPIGKIGLHNFYTWDWKAEALPIVGNQGTVGVIAQEAQKISPDAVFEVDGILKVDYSRIF